MIENPNNIQYVCKECIDKLYPNKGKFTREQLLKAEYIKAPFTDGISTEHMWVKVTKVNENDLEGILDTEPTEISNVMYGDAVGVPFSEIEDIFTGVEHE